MTQEDLLEAGGVVPYLMARVLLDSGAATRDSGRKSSRMSARPAAHRIGLLVGDRATDEMTATT